MEGKNGGRNERKNAGREDTNLYVVRNRICQFHIDVITLKDPIKAMQMQKQ